MMTVSQQNFGGKNYDFFKTHDSFNSKSAQTLGDKVKDEKYQHTLFRERFLGIVRTY